jgi:hypothetical protein
MQERRQHYRHLVNKSAQIVFAGQAPLIDCIVCDLTNAGAGLLFATKMRIPDFFELSFDNFRSARFCRVAWKSAERLGVCFR